MRYFVLLLLCLLCRVTEAQTVTHIIPLSPAKKLRHLGQPPFDSVVVYDNRFDDRIAVGSDGLHPVHVRILDTPAAIAIARYVKAVSPGGSKQTLYISLKQLRFENQYAMTLHFAADAFIAGRKVAAIERNYTVRSSFNSNYFKNEVVHALNDLVIAVNKGKFLDSSNYAFSQIDQNVTETWAGLPVLLQSSYPQNATYNTINEFRENKPKPANLSLTLQSDSSYAAANLYDPVYAIAYKGQLYIRILRNFFLPLRRSGNLLTFRIPQGMPDMDAIFAAANAGTGIYGAGMNSNGPAANILIGALVNTVLTAAGNAADRKQADAITSRGLSEMAMRNCFLDMDTGDIVYR